MAVSRGKADLHIFIDVNPELSLQRIHQSRENIEMYETLDNLVKVRNQYLLAFEKTRLTENIVFVDGNQSPEKVAEEIRFHFNSL
jgi:dTMP kinase